MPSDFLQVEWEDGTNASLLEWEESKTIAQRVLDFLFLHHWRTACTPGVQLDCSMHDRRLHGIVDWLARDPEGALCLVDFKVSKAPPTFDTCVDFDQQLGFYAWLLRQRFFDEPLHLYQLRILGKNPQMPSIVKHQLSRKGLPRRRPEMGKILTTWELWSNMAIECGEDPYNDEYAEQRNYLDNIAWQTFTPVFCPEDVQDAHANNLLAWKEKIDSQSLAEMGLRNFRNYPTGPCNSSSPFSRRCQFIEPCQTDLLTIPRPTWAPKDV